MHSTASLTPGDDEAFDVLVSSSQDTDVELVDAACRLVGEAGRRRAARVTGGGTDV